MTQAFAERTERRSVTVNSRKTSINIRPSVWAAFVKITKASGSNTQKEINLGFRSNDIKTLSAWVEAYVKSKADGPVYSFTSRDVYLGAIVNAMRPTFAERGYPLPERIRATIGFPSTGWRGKRRGECWKAEASSDGTTEIFIHPCEDNPDLIVNILTHELCHAAINCKGGHGKLFKQVGEAMNLEGEPKKMLGGTKWRAWIKPIIDAVGPMPHAALAEHTAKEPKKQSTRNLKCECPACGFTFRTTAKWLEGKGYIQCPDTSCGETITLDKPDEDSEED